MPDDMCRECRYAAWDYIEYYGGAKQWFLVGCQKDMAPIYDEEEEAWECEEYKEDMDD